jgi:hypothetical protein
MIWQPVELPYDHRVAVTDMLYQRSEPRTVIPSPGHCVGERLRHAGSGEGFVLLIQSLDDGGDAGVKAYDADFGDRITAISGTLAYQTNPSGLLAKCRPS